MKLSLIAGLVLSLPVLPTLACSCLDQKITLSENYAKTQAIFTGTVTARSSRPVAGSYIYEFQLVEVLKGPINTPTKVKTGAMDGGCGFPFEEKKTYLVFAYQEADTGDYHTGICSLTQSLDNASKDIQTLRELKKNSQRK